MLSQDAICSCRGVSCVSGGDPALVLGPLEHTLAVGVPAVVELAPVLVDVLLGRVVGAVDRAAGPVHEEGPVRGQRLVLVQPADGVVRQVLVQVVALVRGLRRQHERRVPDQVRLELRGLPGQEPVEVLEPRVRRPVLERARRAGLDGRRVVPLAPRSGGVAVVLQHFRPERAALGYPPRNASQSLANSVITPVHTLWWLRPVSSDARVGEHKAVVWNRL